jgi:hypothetical protein
VFRPSPASVATIQHFQENAKLSRNIVDYHRDGIPPVVLAFFSCVCVGASLPTTERVSTVLATAGSLSSFPDSSLKLRRLV